MDDRGRGLAMVWEPYRFEFVRASDHDEAEYLRICLELELVEASRICRWADELIAVLPRPPIEVIDLALMVKEPEEMFDRALVPIARGADVANVVRQVLGRIRDEAEKMDQEMVLSLLYRLRYWTDELAGFRDRVDEMNWATEDDTTGHEVIEWVRERLAAFFRDYAAEDRIGPTLGLTP